jgi:hypothetical protein
MRLSVYVSVTGFSIGLLGCIMNVRVLGTGGGTFVEAVEFGTFVNNGMIEIPAEYRKDYFADLRVILLKNKTEKDIKDFSIQERVAAAERLVGIATGESMTLEEIRNERLARQ